MNILKKIKKPRLLIYSIAMQGWLKFMRDETYLKLIYWSKFGKKLDLNNPKTFNEKLHWLKLNYRRPEFSKMVDKYEAKNYIESRIGKDYIIPTIGVWNTYEEINFDELPAQFVLKCTHDSGGLVICRDKQTLDFHKMKKKIKKCMKRNYYWVGREWPYKDVKPRIIAEKYLEENSSEENVITDYKFFCFNGEPKIMYISKDKAEHPCTDFFDMDFNHLNIRMRDPNAKKKPEKPKEFDEMKRISKKLADGLPHLRVDFYIINHKVYVGELTFYHNSGFANISPASWDKKLCDWIN